MKKLKISIAVFLLAATVACSTKWIVVLDDVLASAAPALINILEIAALSKGTTFDPALATKINKDAALVQTTASDFSSASAAAAPDKCSQLQAAITVYQSDLPMVLEVAQVTNPNTNAKIVLLSTLISGVFQSIRPLIPNCNAPVLAMAAGTPPLPIKNFVSSYNNILTAKTGDVAVDARTKGMKLKRGKGFWSSLGNALGEAKFGGN